MTIADTNAALAPVLTVEEAAQRLRIGRTLMYGLIASGDVESANHDAGLFAHAGVSPGVWVLLGGAVVASIGALWTLSVDR